MVLAVLPPSRLGGGGPAGVVDGWLVEKPEGAGVVDPVGVEVEETPDPSAPKVDVPSAAPVAGLGGVCAAVPKRPPDGFPKSPVLPV